ncbi:hypothetical protein ACMD2_18406 [Ananas comosus]|uniref:Uncharacterized protein n=1 Tax=Ananas comosus TaxID=4615 RepID=A0A199W2L0_ANACO|nr:hypothetical protein ACMD2_18406 [Ananas comosus]
MEHGSIIGSSVSLCNFDVGNDMNEEVEEVTANEQICMSKHSIDEPRYSKSATNEKGQPQNSQGCNTPKKQMPNRRTGCKAHIISKIDD